MVMVYGNKTIAIKFHDLFSSQTNNFVRYLFSAPIYLNAIDRLPELVNLKRI